MAVEVAGPDALRAVVRSALATMPVSASTHDLRAWQRSELLGADLPERMWLDAVVHSSEEDEPTRFARLEDVRKAFQAQDDVDGELSVLLHQGSLARAQGDFDSLVALLSRGEVLAARGDERARSLVALGQAIAAQLAGRPDDAVRAVDSVTTNSLPVDWVAQALMIRGVNLLLSGRLEAAIASLEAATGEGSEGSLATAHDLLSTARWQAGDSIGALDDAAQSVSYAARVGPPARLQLSQAWLACLLAATGRTGEANALLALVHSGGPLLSSEGAALTVVAEALLHIDDPDTARFLLESADAPDRPLRSSLLRRALMDALSPVGAPATPSPDMPGFDQAIAAGAAGQLALAGGPPAEPHHRPYLPARWCVAGPASTTVSLFGLGTVRRNHRGRRSSRLAARPRPRTLSSLGRCHPGPAAPGRCRLVARTRRTKRRTKPPGHVEPSAGCPRPRPRALPRQPALTRGQRRHPPRSELGTACRCVGGPAPRRIRDVHTRRPTRLRARPCSPAPGRSNGPASRCDSCRRLVQSLPPAPR